MTKVEIDPYEIKYSQNPGEKYRRQHASAGLPRTQDLERQVRRKKTIENTLKQTRDAGLPRG